MPININRRLSPIKKASQFITHSSIHHARVRARWRCQFLMFDLIKLEFKTDETRMTIK